MRERAGLATKTLSHEAAQRKTSWGALCLGALVAGFFSTLYSPTTEEAVAGAERWPPKRTPFKNNKPRRGDSTVSVPCVGACGGLLGLARGHPQYCDERAAPAFSNAVSGVTLAKCSAAKKQLSTLRPQPPHQVL